MAKLIVDVEEEQREILEVLERIKEDEPLELYAVAKNKAGQFAFYCSGRIHGMGTAASIMNSEFMKRWNDDER